MIVSSTNEGRSWTAGDEPALNLAGLLVVGSRRLGRAPKNMRFGSGCYSLVVADKDPSPAELAEIQTEHEAEKIRRRQAWFFPELKDNSAAKARASNLLLSHLSSNQRSGFLSDRAFQVVSKSGARYLIQDNYTNNVFRLDDHGVKIQRYCAHSVVNVPVEDNMLAQKLLLEHDEGSFLSKTNAGLPAWETRRGPDGQPELLGIGAIVEGERVFFPRGVNPIVFSSQLEDGGPLIACTLVNGVVAPLAVG